MKKITFLLALIGLSISVYSQNSKPVLRTEMDTLAYAYGVNITQMGLEQYLMQLGVLENTEVVDEDLLPEVEARNKISLQNFMRGVEQSLKNTSEDEKAFAQGIALGGQIQQMLTSLQEELSISTEAMNTDILLAGMRNVLDKEPLLFEDAGQVFQEKMMAEQEKKGAILAADGEAFLRENALKDGVVTLPSGLQYKVIEAGTGEIPTEEDRVKVNYEGRLIDGTVFDSSYERGEPAVFGITQVIRGWTEALQLMPVGSKWELYIPHDLGYGARDTGVIKPYSVLIFDVELLGIE